MRLPLSRDAGVEAVVVSASNLLAAAALEDFPNGADRVLALCGPAGCGKTVLAERWAQRVGAAPLHGGEAALIDPLELEGRAVLLDRAPDADDETLFHLLNLAQSPGGALLLVGRAAPSQWTVALPDLRSRLDSIRTVSVGEPDDAVLRAILASAFQRRSIRPAEDVLTYLVARIDRSAEAVERVVERLDAAHRPVTRVLARQILEGSDASGDLFD